MLSSDLVVTHEFQKSKSPSKDKGLDDAEDDFRFVPYSLRHFPKMEWQNEFKPKNLVAKMMVIITRYSLRRCPALIPTPCKGADPVLRAQAGPAYC